MAGSTVQGKCLKCDGSVIESAGKLVGPRGVECFANGFGPHVVAHEGMKTVEHTLDVDGKLVLVRYCGYCWAEYLEPKAHRSYFCSPECSKRNQAWNRWVADTNTAAVHGDVSKPAKVGPALPVAGVTLTAAVERFQLTFELAEVA